MTALQQQKQETQTFFKDEPEFWGRHIGPRQDDVQKMLKELSFDHLKDFVHEVIPSSILSQRLLDLPEPLSEYACLSELDRKSQLNVVAKSYLGQGFHESLIPPVIRRIILENPSWYSAYTPYQAEISQGRLEMLLNFQQMIMDLTGFSIANASLLDEASACAEAMSFLRRISAQETPYFLIDHKLHPQNIAVLKTHAHPLDIQLVIGDPEEEFEKKEYFGIILQYPDTEGRIKDYSAFIQKVKLRQCFIAMACDILALTLLKTPCEMGADVAIGSTQRFGLPLGFGGPHAAYFATNEQYKRQIPGRLIGVSIDAKGRKALRMSLQTREQHIRRDKATSNICTAQALPAILATAFAIYKGPEGLKAIARKVSLQAKCLGVSLEKAGYKLLHESFFDTIVIMTGKKTDAFIRKAALQNLNFRKLNHEALLIALNETTSNDDLLEVLSIFDVKEIDFPKGALESASRFGSLSRHSTFLEHSVFNTYHSETEFMRYIKFLADKDLALDQAMIPLGSCTMKLNSATELTPITFKGFANIHPFAPQEQTKGYLELCQELSQYLAEITGFDAVSLQPNSGSQGEFAGLLAIKEYHVARGHGHRKVCLIPTSAHGTNPASAKLVGYEVVPVPCDLKGNVDVMALKHIAHEHKDDLAVFMITYPSTHGVFEAQIKKIIELIHENGGQVYIDGANLNALVGLARFADLGGDVCHMNLHKTFCIPHGGGGPGIGPIGVKKHLSSFLPSESLHQVAASDYGSAMILPISWAYIRLMGSAGLRRATEIALLNANYIAYKLAPYYPILYSGSTGRVAHECIIDLRSIREQTGITVDDIAKRLIDYGFHAPTISFPVSGTMMIEPTESESKVEIDRFIEAMILIHGEIHTIQNPENNLLKNAPHVIQDLIDDWSRPYSKEQAFFPSEHTKKKKYWAPVARVNHDYGDRNLFCGCS